ncbi:MAG TPA: CoA-transferase [Solirubrobacteraceae bacterium]|nr:CoA-transferase [Solirubrobacteraceae bacterium]
MSGAGEWTAEELMTVAASRELRDGQVCLVGVGPPNAAANLARRLHAPDAVLVYESGAIGAKPARLPLSIGDDDLAATADELVSVVEMFNYWVGGGRIDVGFLGAAQLDRRGRINTTVIGPYSAPKVRLPGAGGAPEIAANAREVIVLVRHSKRVFVEELAFTTSVPPSGRLVVCTDLGILRRGGDGELELRAVHPGVTVDDVRAETGWELRVADELEESPPPTAEELETLRDLRRR